MEILELLRLLLWYVGVFAVLGLADTLLAAGAFRLNLGPAEMPYEPGEYWRRSAAAGFALAAYTVVAAFIALVLFNRAYWLFGVLMLVYAVLAVYLYDWSFALDDLLEGFKIFLIHHVPPCLVLLVLFAFFLKPDSFLRFVLPIT